MSRLPIRDRRYGRPLGELCRRHCYRHLGALRPRTRKFFSDRWLGSKLFDPRSPNFG